MIFYIKNLKLPELFICNLLVFLSTSFAVANAHEAHGAEAHGTEGQDEQLTETCSFGSDFDASTYNLGLHVGAFFIILFTSSLGAFIPVISKKFPAIKVPSVIFFFCKHFGTGVIVATAFIHMIPSSFQMLSNECLPEVWRNYPSWPGAIAMMAATFIFFIEYIALSSTHNDKHETLPTHTTQKNELDHSDDSTAEEDAHHSHAHAHGTLVLLTSKSQTIGIIILELGICFHSIIIGMALSVATGSDFVSLLVALVFHQMFEGLGLGSRIAILEFPRNSIKPWLMSLAYGTTTPFGIAVGLGVRESYNPDSPTALIVQGVLDSISAGILLYAALVELIASDFIFDPKFRKKSTTYQASAFIFLLLGAGIMSLIGYWA